MSAYFAEDDGEERASIPPKPALSQPPATRAHLYDDTPIGARFEVSPRAAPLLVFTMPALRQAYDRVAQGLPGALAGPVCRARGRHFMLARGTELAARLDRLEPPGAAAAGAGELWAALGDADAGGLIPVRLRARALAQRVLSLRGTARLPRATIALTPVAANRALLPGDGAPAAGLLGVDAARRVSAVASMADAVGVWVAGVDHPQHPLAWRQMLRFRGRGPFLVQIEDVTYQAEVSGPEGEVEVSVAADVAVGGPGDGVGGGGDVDGVDGVEEEEVVLRLLPYSTSAVPSAAASPPAAIPERAHWGQMPLDEPTPVPRAPPSPASSVLPAPPAGAPLAAVAELHGVVAAQQEQIEVLQRQVAELQQMVALLATTRRAPEVAGVSGEAGEAGVQADEPEAAAEPEPEPDTDEDEQPLDDVDVDIDDDDDDDDDVLLSLPESPEHPGHPGHPRQARHPRQGNPPPSQARRDIPVIEIGDLDDDDDDDVRDDDTILRLRAKYLDAADGEADDDDDDDGEGDAQWIRARELATF